MPMFVNVLRLTTYNTSIIRNIFIGYRPSNRLANNHYQNHLQITINLKQNITIFTQ